jgi:hypothetical protein
MGDVDRLHGAAGKAIDTGQLVGDVLDADVFGLQVEWIHDLASIRQNPWLPLWYHDPLLWQKAIAKADGAVEWMLSSDEYWRPNGLHQHSSIAFQSVIWVNDQIVYGASTVFGNRPMDESDQFIAQHELMPRLSSLSLEHKATPD